MKHPLVILALVIAPLAANAADVTSPWSPDASLATEDRLDIGTNAIHSGALAGADMRLADDVAQALAADARLDGATITVSARDGRVSLSGSAENLEQAQHAEQVARRVFGVTSVSGTLDAQGG